MKKLTIFLFLFILLLPTALAARDKIKFNLDINTWCEGDSNYSKFNLSIFPEDDDRDLTINDENFFTYYNEQSINRTFNLRFGLYDEEECINQSLESLESVLGTLSDDVKNTYNVCKDTKQITDTSLAACENEMSSIKDNATKCGESLSTREKDYIDINTQLTAKTKEATDCEKSKTNMWWFIFGALILGFLVAGPFGGWDWWRGRKEKKSLVDKETGRDVPVGGEWKDG